MLQTRFSHFANNKNPISKAQRATSSKTISTIIENAEKIENMPINLIIKKTRGTTFKRGLKLSLNSFLKAEQIRTKNAAVPKIRSRFFCDGGSILDNGENITSKKIEIANKKEITLFKKEIFFVGLNVETFDLKAKIKIKLTAKAIRISIKMELPLCSGFIKPLFESIAKSKRKSLKAIETAVTKEKYI